MRAAPEQRAAARAALERLDPLERARRRLGRDRLAVDRARLAAAVHAARLAERQRERAEDGGELIVDAETARHEEDAHFAEAHDAAHQDAGVARDDDPARRARLTDEARVLDAVGPARVVARCAQPPRETAVPR